jgi:hypothetical protein
METEKAAEMQLRLALIYIRGVIANRSFIDTAEIQSVVENALDDEPEVPDMAASSEERPPEFVVWPEGMTEAEKARMVEVFRTNPLPSGD